MKLTVLAHLMPTVSAFPTFDTSYTRLPSSLFAHVAPYGASHPKIIRVNEGLAEVLGFHLDGLEDDQLAHMFAGNDLSFDGQPLAMAYAGHQFGHFNPGLGDGRALLLGEVIGSDAKRYDIQLKGSGQTPYSRQGDGRAALGPVLREYVVSEAMAALGIPTTRALAAITTGDPVLRDGLLPGAMVTRVASSHLRVGTFELAHFRGDISHLEALVGYALARHDPDRDSDHPAGLQLLEGTIERQAVLIAHWMRVGFIHGVMNTDNCTISGETIDYGPCAFMDAYNPQQVYSSIDHHGRYAYANQPAIAHWNMAVLAEALLPVIDQDRSTAVRLAQEAVDRFPTLFQDAYLESMRRKLGLSHRLEGDDGLIRELMQCMTEAQSDFTSTFRALANADENAESALNFLGDAGRPWMERWRARRLADGGSPAAQTAMMLANNPVVIARNHALEAVIEAAMDGDFVPFHQTVDALGEPFRDRVLPEHAQLLTGPPLPEQVVHATFCGT